jgi:hypothetical protein
VRQRNVAWRRCSGGGHVSGGGSAFENGNTFVSVSYLGNGYAFPFPMAEQI